MGLKSTTTGGGGGGEIIQVEGGHIIRAMGRKDRHSKVFTAKGPRDRRVRLSAHTAIQFYDVQDRLGFDRPSKAVDWLINKAKASIDELAHLPPWNPPHNYNNNNNINNVGGSNSTEFPVPDRTESSIYNQDDDVDNGVGECMKSFFPISSTTCGEENQMSFQSYPAGVQSHQDLCLSLHTLPDDADQGPGSGTHSGHDHQVGLFPGPGSMGFDGGWTQQHDLGRFTRMMGWAGGGGGHGEREGRGGIMFNNPSHPQFQQQLGYNNSNNFERGTLQSSFYPLVVHPGMGPGPGPENFMGFCNPSSQQIQAHGLLHGGGDLSNNRASSSSLSPDDSSQH